LKSMYSYGHQSPEFCGMAIVRLASDPKIMEKTGKILITSRLAREYNYTDLDGKISGDFFSVMIGLPLWFPLLFPSLFSTSFGII
ncbi:Dehydrogenase/reductase (SDR family) member 1, partial [Caligus rogercresseyi]